MRDLPNLDPPEIFGQHINAEIQSQINDTEQMLGTLVSIQDPIFDDRDLGAVEPREAKVRRGLLIFDSTAAVTEFFQVPRTYSSIPSPGHPHL